ncbi:MAG TPA: hypothetical protein VHP58_00235 [Alphaproteobacteria bacterium]|nr:hypothetical protein [Alphaproteobacteria bacterium]
MALLDLAGDVLDGVADKVKEGEEDVEIQKLINDYGIAPEDREEFAAAYHNEKHPINSFIDNTVGISEKPPRSTEQIIKDTRERQERDRIRAAQKTLSAPGARIFEDDYNKPASLLDYSPRKLGR